MTGLRISGIVGIANQVRRVLSMPFTPGQRETLAQRVEHSLSQIDTLLARHGARAADLPPPSRRAYEFLRQLDVRSMPIPSAPGSAGGDGDASDDDDPRGGETVRFPGLRAYLTRILDDIALSMIQGRFNLPATLQVILNTATRLNHVVARDNIAPAHLRPEPRQLLGWFRHFSNEPALAGYAEAVRRAQRVLPSPLSAHTRWRQPFIVHYRPSGLLYRIQVLRDGTRMIFDTPMITFDEATMRQLAQRMLGRHRNQEAMMAAMTGAEYKGLLAELNTAGGVVEHARGLTYDLGESFNRVNAEYFAGQMPRPALSWSRALTGRKFGHYDFVHDHVCVSRTLDSPGVPGFVVDHVMHHELLHKKHGLRFHGQRQHAHTPEFRREEHSFRQYREADEFLKRLSEGH